MLTKDEKNLIAFAIGLFIGGGACYACAADLSIADQVSISGPVKVVDSYIEFPDGTRLSSAVTPDTSAIWGNITGLIQNQNDLASALDSKENLISKGVANGYAPLDASGKVPAAFLPAGGGSGSPYKYSEKRLSVADFVNTWEIQDDIWVPFVPFVHLFEKSSSDSFLRLTWSDSVGIYSTVWCNVGLFLDDQITPVCVGAWSGSTYTTTFQQQTISCVLSGISAGSHTLSVKHRSQYCMYGNYAFDQFGLNRFISVEEM